MAWNLPDAIADATDRTAAWFNAIVTDCLGALDQHTHDNASGGGATLTGQHARRDEVFVSPGLPASGSQFASRLAYAPGGSYFIQELFNNSPAQNDAAEFYVSLGAGVYTLKLVYRKTGTSGGIASLYWNGALVGNIDSYASAASVNQEAEVEDLRAEAGLNTLQLIMQTKNAASSNYAFSFSGLHFHRTGD